MTKTNIDYINRNNYLDLLSEKYVIYLNNIKDIILDPILYDSTNEGRNKILSNIDLTLKKIGKVKHYKYVLTDYYSEEAALKIKNNDFKNLIYEHIVPKNIYQNQIFNLLQEQKTITKQYIFDILKKYWYIATITKDQDTLLNNAKLRLKMPDKLDDKNIFARYQTVRIKLIKTNYFN